VPRAQWVEILAVGRVTDPDSATSIGPGRGKLCEREDGAQRVFPASGKQLRIDENERLSEPYGVP